MEIKYLTCLIFLSGRCNHPCSICGVSTSRNMCLSLKNCLCCITQKTNGNAPINS